MFIIELIIFSWLNVTPILGVEEFNGSISSADYFNNKEINNSIFNLIFPNSEDKLVNIELPDDSLADADLKDHNFIDSYYNFGNKNVEKKKSKKEKNYLKYLIVLSIFNEIMLLYPIYLIFCRKILKKVPYYHIKHILVLLFINNLVFSLGVNKTDYPKLCFLTASAISVVEHQISLWILIYVIYFNTIYCPTWTINFFMKNPRYSIIIVPVTSIFFAMDTHYRTPDTFETTEYCFRSYNSNFGGKDLWYYLIVAFLTVIYGVKFQTRMTHCLFEYHVIVLTYFKETNSARRKNTDKIIREVEKCGKLQYCMNYLLVFNICYMSSWWLGAAALHFSIHILETENLSNNFFVIGMYIFASILQSLILSGRIKGLVPKKLSPLESVLANENNSLLNSSQTSSA